MSIISIKNLSKHYIQSNNVIPILNNLSLDIEKGQSVAVIGASGSGKTTLLYMLSGLDNVNQGNIFIDGIDITKLDENEKTLFRANNCSFIFQHHFLLQDLNAIDNVLLPLRIVDNLNKYTKQKAEELFEYFGLTSRIKHLPDELSGGEKQRIAIIRSLVTNPKIIFADEPTGSLDRNNANLLENLFFDLLKKENVTLIVSTHNQELADKCDHIYTISSLEQL